MFFLFGGIKGEGKSINQRWTFGKIGRKNAGQRLAKYSKPWSQSSWAGLYFDVLRMACCHPHLVGSILPGFQGGLTHARGPLRFPGAWLPAGEERGEGWDNRCANKKRES